MFSQELYFCSKDIHYLHFVQLKLLIISLFVLSDCASISKKSTRSQRLISVSWWKIYYKYNWIKLLSKAFYEDVRYAHYFSTQSYSSAFFKKAMFVDFTCSACTFHYKHYYQLIHMLVFTLGFVQSETHLDRFQRRRMIFKWGSNGTIIRGWMLVCIYLYKNDQVRLLSDSIK